MNILKIWWGILNKNWKQSWSRGFLELAPCLAPFCNGQFCLCTACSWQQFQSALHYIRGQILELPNGIIVLESDFRQTLAPLFDPNATFKHLRQMMSPLWTWICRHVSGYIIDKAVCISQDSTLNSMLTYLFSGKKWGVCAIK